MENIDPNKIEVVIACTPGLEELLEAEVRELCGEIQHLKSSYSTLRAWLSPEQLCEVLVMSRLASRLHVPLREFSARHPEMIYDQVRRINWTDYLSSEKSFRIQSRGQTGDMSLHFATLKIKDAICDEIKKQGFDRPNIDRNNPDVSLTAFFDQNRCELLLDLSTNALHRRGYGEKRGLAPLRENRAAALCRFAKTKFGDEVFNKVIVDPFCGSATLILEALLWRSGAPARVQDIVPKSFAHFFPTLLPIAEERAQRALDESKKYFEERQGEPLAYAFDIEPSILDMASISLQRAGLSKYVKLKKADARELAMKDVLILCNPPWGERLDNEDATQLLSDFGHRIKHHCAPVHVAMTLGQGLSKKMGFRPSHRLEVDNGESKMDFCLYEVYEGSRKNAQ